MTSPGSGVVSKAAGWRLRLCLGAGLALATAGSAPAQTANTPVVQAPPQAGASRGEIEILQNDQRRREFQIEQQFHREQDRNATTYRSQRFDIPLMRGSCMTAASRIGTGC